MSRASFMSNMSELSAGSAEALAELKEKLINFYKVYDPSKLEDEVKVNELLLWARKYSAKALVGLMQRKYGVSIEEVDSSEEGWESIRQQLFKFYKKHDRSKPDEEIEKIYRWTRQHGLAKLNERLVSKYGVPLQSVNQQGGGLSNFKERYRHLVLAQDAGNLSDEIKAFYAQFEPTKSAEEIDRIIQYGMKHGREAVNENLAAKYGKTLEDVQLAEGATHEERMYNLRTRLQTFYEKHDPSQLTDNKLDAMVEWGIVNYAELNQHLLRTYGYDLDSKTLDVDELRYLLFSYFSSLPESSKKKKGKNETEELVEFALANGREALSQRLLFKYGRPLPDGDVAQLEEAKKLFAEQAPKMSRFSIKSIRRSLSNALRRNSGSDRDD